MSGPWEKYAPQDTADAKPWEKYSSAEDSRPATNPRPGYFDNLINATKAAGAADIQHPALALPGMGEAALNAATGFVAPLPGAMETIVDRIRNRIGMPDPANPTGDYATARNSWVYEPRTPNGQARAEQLGAAMRPVSDALTGAGNYLGNVTGNVTGNEQLARDVKQMTPDMLGLATLKAPEIVRGLRDRSPVETVKPIPTTEQLRDAKTKAYKAGNESDILTTPEQNTATINNINKTLKDENLLVDPDLHPKSTALLRRLEAQKGQPLTVPEAESLRQLANEVQNDIDPVTKQPTADAYRAGVILDEMDSSLDTLSANKTARELNGRFRRSQMVDQMIHRAEIRAGAQYTQAGMEHALRLEFKQLALNPRRMRFFNPEQKAAIEKVATGGAVENTLRGLGKFDPTTGGMASLVSLGTSGLASTVFGPIGLALPPVGFVARRAATAMTKRNVDAAREALVGRGMPQPEPVAQPAAVSTAVTGQVMPRTPLALPAPNIIAGSRSAPGTAYAREQMGLTPDIERAGMLHPGVAKESLAPRTAVALPNRAAPGLLTDQRPMVIDSVGRVSATREQLRDYLKETGQDRMRNVRQPRTGLLEKQQEDVRTAIHELEDEARKKGLFEQVNPSASQRAAEAEWTNRYQQAVSKAGKQSRD